jgi:ankyrin repeat protein
MCLFPSTYSQKKHGGLAAYREQKVSKAMTDIHLVAYVGLTDVVKVLAEAGNDGDAKNSNERISLFRVAWKGQDNVVELLLNTDPVPDSRPRWQDSLALGGMKGA